MVSTHFQEIDVEIFVHVDLAAMDRVDNCRGVNYDCVDVVVSVEVVRLIESLELPLGWQR